MVPVSRNTLQMSPLCAAAVALSLTGCLGHEDESARTQAPPSTEVGTAISAANAANFAAEALAAATALEFGTSAAVGRILIVEASNVVRTDTVRSFDARPLTKTQTVIDVNMKVNNDIIESVKGGLLVDDLDTICSVRCDHEMTSDLLTTERRIAGVVRATRSLSQVRLQDSQTTSSEDVSLAASFAVSGSFPVLGQISFQVQTPVPLLFQNAKSQPASGVVKASGNGNTSVTATLEGDKVRLQVDTNGDGTTDVEETLSRAAINALM